MPTQKSDRQLGAQGTSQKLTCFMQVERGQVREMNLPVGRAALSPSGSFLLMEANFMPTIRKCLLDPVVTKRDPTRLLHAAGETIASYPAGVTTICTDGSVQSSGAL
ncbi:colorectal mutant cancer protein [Biomphalaria glabrata]|nr:colorectal mutant cancer protein-like [Biomphalaria glabrata]